MLDENEMKTEENPNDSLHVGLVLLSFCIPIAGAIIYFANKDSYPNAAKTACHSALWGFGIGIVIRILATMAQVGQR